VTCDNGPRAAGIAELTFSNTVNVASTTAVAVLTLSVPGNPSGAVNLQGHVLLDRTGANSQYDVSIQSGSCTGTTIAHAFWRAQAITGNEHQAQTISLTGTATGVTATTTFVLCAALSTAASTAAIAQVRGLTAGW
jgi:hypothetical protein